MSRRKVHIKIGANIHIGYYDQIQENLNMDKTVIDEVWDEYPNLTQTQIRNALAVFLLKVKMCSRKYISCPVARELGLNL